MIRRLLAWLDRWLHEPPRSERAQKARAIREAWERRRKERGRG